MTWILIASMLGGCNLVTHTGLCGERLMPWERARTAEVDTGFAMDDCPTDTWEQGELLLHDARCDDGDDCFVEPTVRITEEEVVFEYTSADGVQHQARYLRTD